MPVDELIAYYNKNLRGRSNIPYTYTSLRISDTLDSYVDMPIKELRDLRWYDIREKWSTLKKKELGKYYENHEDYIHLRTKYACVKFIKYAQSIKYIQQVIKKETYSKDNYTRLRSDIEAAYSVITEIKTWTVDEDFRNNIVTLIDKEIKRVYMYDEKDFKDTTDYVIEYLSPIIMFIFIIFLFWAWGRCSAP